MSNLLFLAANGNADAQAELASKAMEAAANGPAVVAEAMTAAEIWARMAASHGRPNDLLQLAGLLFCRAGMSIERGDEAAAAMQQAEAVSILSEGADLGDEYAADALNVVSDVLEPAIMQESRRFPSCIIKRGEG
jgi:hypothetical protein